MGTRHLQTVINKKGETKVSQYGQWDGYPDGQGIEILNFLRSIDLNTYEERLELIQEATQEFIDDINKRVESIESPLDELKNNNEYYALHRDCGSDIHYLIYENKIKYVMLEEDNSWCEGFYTIDFKNNEFITEYHGYKKVYNLNKLPTKKQYLRHYNNWKKKNE